MYYINDEHKENFCEMVGKFPRAMDGDRHMQLACYISAIPNIYSQIKGHIVGHHPFNWYVAYKNGKTNIELDHQHQQIVIAGLHMAGVGTHGEDSFNMYITISAMWSDELYRAFKQALEIARNTIKSWMLDPFEEVPYNTDDIAYALGLNKNQAHSLIKRLYAEIQ